MTQQYLMANGLRLAYEEFGDPSKPAIILIMGLGMQMLAWPRAFCEGLADAGFRVIRFDNRDIGLSEKIDTSQKVGLVTLLMRKKLGLKLTVPYSLRDMAKDTVGILDYLEIDKAHWVGASMGGMIAQIVVAEHPDRSLSLTSIMSTTGNPELPQASNKVVSRMLRRPSATNERVYLKHSMALWSLIGSPGYPPTDAALEERILASVRRSFYPKGRLHQMAAILDSGDRRGLLRKIKHPSLVIHGKADVLVPCAGGIDTAKHLANAQLKLVEGMGHDLPEELIPEFIEWISVLANSVNQTID